MVMMVEAALVEEEEVVGVREVVTHQLVVSHVFVASRALPSYSYTFLATSRSVSSSFLLFFSSSSAVDLLTVVRSRINPRKQGTQAGTHVTGVVRLHTLPVTFAG